MLCCGVLSREVLLLFKFNFISLSVSLRACVCVCVCAVRLQMHTTRCTENAACPPTASSRRQLESNSKQASEKHGSPRCQFQPLSCVSFPFSLSFLSLRKPVFFALPPPRSLRLWYPSAFLQSPLPISPLLLRLHHHPFVELFLCYFSFLHSILLSFCIPLAAILHHPRIDGFASSHLFVFAGLTSQSHLPILLARSFQGGTLIRAQLASASTHRPLRVHALFFHTIASLLLQITATTGSKYTRFLASIAAHFFVVIP